MNTSLGSIAEAKEEYTKQLTNILRNAVFDKLMEMYRTCKSQTEKKTHILIEFQKMLKEVPHWNNAYIDTEIQKIQNSCSWFKDLVAAIFISNVKILSSVKVKDSKHKLRFKMPDIDLFVHNVYWKSAENVYNNPTLFSLQRIDDSKDEIRSEITNAINETISSILPFEDMLHHLRDSLNDESSDDNDIPSDGEMDPKSDDDNDDNDDNDVSEQPAPPPDENFDNVLNGEEGNNTEGGGFFDKPNDVKTIPAPGQWQPGQGQPGQGQPGQGQPGQGQPGQGQPGQGQPGQGQPGQGQPGQSFFNDTDTPDPSI
jgi:hypothetical protein